MITRQVITPYTNHSRWHQCVRWWGLRVCVFIFGYRRVIYLENAYPK